MKQLGIATMMSASVATLDVDVYPKLPVEPFPTFYLRTARAYRFVGGWLRALEPELLASGHRLTEDGTSSALPLGDELQAMTELLYGLHLLSAESIGASAQASLLDEELAEFPLEACRARAESWLSGWKEDTDVRRDPRVMVPVAATDTQVIYWATIGIKLYKARAAFVAGFEPQVLGTGTCGVKGFVPHDYYWLAEDQVEVRLNQGVAPLTRSELRALCDAKQTHAAIVAALEAL